MPSKATRLREFIRRLEQAPPAADATEARDQIERTLNAVEDEFTLVPYEPTQWQSGGRMYPPHDDSMVATNNSSVICFRSLLHRTYIGVNGAIEIRMLNKTVLFSKCGADGKEIKDLM